MSTTPSTDVETLVVGASGLVGGNVLATADDAAGTYHTTAPDLDAPSLRLDITDADHVRRVVEGTAPDLVVNCAAMTDVDVCQRHPDRAWAVNATAAGMLADAAATIGATLVQFSTDYVFDGDHDEPYPEDAPIDPQQVYGQTKLAGERVVRQHHPSPLILRLSFVHGIDRNTGDIAGFPAWVRDRLSGNNEVPLFNDQHVTPTRAGQAANVALELADRDISGTVHVAARSCVTPFEFGVAVVEALGSDATRLACGSVEDVDRAAPRPRYTCLDVGRVERLLDRPQPTLVEDLGASVGDT